MKNKIMKRILVLEDQLDYLCECLGDFEEDNKEEEAELLSQQINEELKFLQTLLEAI